MPRIPIHPGEILADELEEIGLSAKKLAHLIEVPPNRLYRILAGKRNVTADTALRLGRYFGMSPDFGMNLQTAAVRLLPTPCVGDSRNTRNATWREYEPAIRRWEAILGRAAPAPTQPSLRAPYGPQLSPRFVEDSVRLMIKTAVESYPQLDNGDFVLARQVNFETIHNHDVLAERFGTVGELRGELEGGEHSLAHTELRDWLGAAV